MAQYKGAASEAGRAMQLMKKREKEREQLEQLKQKIAEVSHFPPHVFTFINAESMRSFARQVCGAVNKTLNLISRPDVQRALETPANYYWLQSGTVVSLKCK